MRKEITLTNALFQKNEPEWEQVEIPHTWNAIDGQAGGGKYHRGACSYKFRLPDPDLEKCQFIRLEAVSMAATVWCNGVELGKHCGGFSAFTFELTEYMKQEGNELVVCADNSQNPNIYPTMGDFTIFGGIYRDVTFYETEKAHIDFGIFGSKGVFLTPDAQTGKVCVDVFTKDAKDCDVVCCVEDMKIQVKAEAQTTFEFTIENPLLWEGVTSPNCYEAVFRLLKGEEILDEVTETFGFRSIQVNPQTGFILNGKSYPLRGVGRHQDRSGRGWALCREDQEQDLHLISEMGANAVRLAHYQHNSYFHSLCDKAGIAVWAEVPYISEYIASKEAQENIKTQMLELICQNYNHPSIFFWGLGNELTMCGDSKGLRVSCNKLNELCHKLDPTRLTAMALMATDKVDSPIAGISDVSGFNQYLGWYVGKMEDNGPWLDEQHRKCPEFCMGLTEYGCDSVLGWHSAEPRAKDYTEEYQAKYHQALLEAIDERPWLWGTFVWNMFDFAASSREEGGSKGRNNKGLVSHDRTVKKDAYFLYKAWWTEEPFVYIAGRRFVNRAPGQRTVQVYSNQQGVTLFVDGNEVQGIEVSTHIFEFKEISLKIGENCVEAKCGDAEDNCIFCGVAEPDQDYVMPEENETENADNWFGEVLEFPEGYYSIRDSMETLISDETTLQAITEAIHELIPEQNMADTAVRMFSGIHAEITLEGVLRAAGNNFPPTARSIFNQKLTKIKKNM